VYFTWLDAQRKEVGKSVSSCCCCRTDVFPWSKRRNVELPKPISPPADQQLLHNNISLPPTRLRAVQTSHHAFHCTHFISSKRRCGQRLWPFRLEPGIKLWFAYLHSPGWWRRPQFPPRTWASYSPGVWSRARGCLRQSARLYRREAGHVRCG